MSRRGKTAIIVAALAASVSIAPALSQAPASFPERATAFPDRPAIAVRLVLGKDGQKRRHDFHRIMMRSHAKLAYAQAQAAIDGRPDDTTAPLLQPVLEPLWAAWRCAFEARRARSPLDLDLPERKILLKPDGTVDRVIVPERLDAHRLIEEFMILANVAAAETLEARKTALLYRVHDEPSVEKLRRAHCVRSSSTVSSRG